MDALGTLSAGTLGYITGGIKGAKRASEVYRSYRNYKNMAPLPSKKNDRGKKRKATFSRTSVKKAKKSSYQKRRSTGNTVVGTAKKTGVVRKLGRKRVVKVSRSLRAKIQKVLDSDKLVGKYLHVKYFDMTPGKPFSGAFDDQQSVEYMGISTQASAVTPGNTNRLLFSPLFVNYAVARLMNPATVSKAAGDPVLFNDQFLTQGVYTKYLDIKTARIKVLKQSATYRVRNNSGRVVTLKFYCVQPKSIDESNGFAGLNPIETWNTGLDIQDDQTTRGENPTGVRTETLFANPKWSSQFKQRYKIEETIVSIEPGKEYNYKVEGPSMEYNYAKFWQNRTFYDQQKFTKQVMVVAYNDITRTDNSLTGRYTDQSVNDPQSILFEQTCYIKFAIPDQTGFVVATSNTGENINLASRRYCFGIDVHQGVQGTGTVQYVTDENPLSLSTIP